MLQAVFVICNFINRTARAEQFNLLSLLSPRSQIDRARQSPYSELYATRAVAAEGLARPVGRGRVGPSRGRRRVGPSRGPRRLGPRSARCWVTPGAGRSVSGAARDPVSGRHASAAVTG